MTTQQRLTESRRRTLTMPDERELPRYKCHKEVHALRISAIVQSPADEQAPIGSEGTWQLHFDDGRYALITVSHEWYKKHEPQVGGYYVVYADGYKSYSPAQAFKEGYTRIQ